MFHDYFFLNRSAVSVVFAGFFIDRFGNGCKSLRIVLNRSAGPIKLDQLSLFFCRGGMFVLFAVCFWLLALRTGLPLQRNLQSAATNARWTTVFWSRQRISER